MAAALLVIGIAAVLTLTSCKYTDVLTQYLEDPDLGQTDEHIDPLFQLDVDSPPDTRVLTVKSDSDRENEQELTLPDFKKDAENEQQADNTVHSDDTPDEQDANEGDEQSEDEGKTSTLSNTGSSQHSQSQTNPTPSNDAGDNTNTNNSAGTGGITTVYDATGTSMELPDNVGCIAAVGQYATIVQMLGGKGGLCACDAEWQNMVAAKGVFPNEGVENLAVAFTGNSTDGYQVDPEALVNAFASTLESGQTGTLFYDGLYLTLSDDEKNQINELAQAKGISVAPVLVPALGKSDSSEADIKSAVNMIGEVLKSSKSTTLDVQEAASKYNEYYDSVVDLSLSANGGNYAFKMFGGSTYQTVYQGTDDGTAVSNMSYIGVFTAYIDSWSYQTNATATAQCAISGMSFGYVDGQTVNVSGGIGLSAVATSKNFMLIDYYLQIGGVVDSSYPYEKPTMSSSGVSTPYVICAGSAGPLVNGLSFTTINSAGHSPLWFSANSLSSSSQFTKPGDDAFPVLLVATNEIGNAVVAASTNHGVYDMGQKYKVAVVPQGIAGRWSKGTVESVLLSIWTIKTENPTESNIEVCKRYVDEFYNKFYRCANAVDSGVIDDYDNVKQAG